MKINECRFVISAVSPAQYPVDEKPEIALAGRSNVGKSSLTNMLINRKGLAKTSSTPGKTQTINFYDIGNAFRFVDLPGYGYAKVSKSQKSTWGKIIETYLRERPNLMEVFLLVDLRHKPSDDDVVMFDWIKSFGFRGIVVATKSDKIKRSQMNSYKKTIRDTLNMQPEDVLFVASAENRDGKYQVWDFINELFESRELPIYFERQIGEPNPEKAKAIRAKAAAIAAERAELLAAEAEVFLNTGEAAVHLPKGIRRAEISPMNEGPATEADVSDWDEVEETDESMAQMDSSAVRAAISSQLRLPKGAKVRKVQK